MSVAARAPRQYPQPQLVLDLRWLGWWLWAAPTHVRHRAILTGQRHAAVAVRQAGAALGSAAGGRCAGSGQAVGAGVRQVSGQREKATMSASWIASAVCRPSGKCVSRVNLLARSATVTIAERCSHR